MKLVKPDTPGRFIAEQIEMRGWSQSEAAIKFGISASYLCDLLHGRRNVNPTLIAGIVAGLSDAAGIRAALSNTLHQLGARQAGWKIDP